MLYVEVFLTGRFPSTSHRSHLISLLSPTPFSYIPHQKDILSSFHHICIRKGKKRGPSFLHWFNFCCRCWAFGKERFLCSPCLLIQYKKKDPFFSNLWILYHSADIGVVELLLFNTRTREWQRHAALSRYWLCWQLTCGAGTSGTDQESIVSVSNIRLSRITNHHT